MKKIILLISALLLVNNIVRADYSEKLPYTLKQPDGTTISCFVSDDVFFNWIHNNDGYTTVGRTSKNDVTDPGILLQNGSEGGLEISNVTAAGAIKTFDVLIPETCLTKNLGNTTVYGSSSTLNYRRAIPITFIEPGDIQSISIYHNGGTGRVLLSVYSNQSGAPSSRLGVTAATPKNTTAGWQTISLTNPVTVTTGQTVWLSWVFETATGVRYTTGTPQRAQSTASWSGDMPATFGSAAFASYKYSVYCTYITCTGGTPPAEPVATPGTDVTTNSFRANWNSVSGATGYRIDIATDNSFTNYVSGHQNIDVGNVAILDVTDLIAGTNYYYRVRSYNMYGSSVNSTTIQVKTNNSDAIQDIEGNSYKILQIGSQVWMAENLKTTKYSDGTNITQPGYCWYNNDISYKDIYGALYDWYTVNTGKLCPTGWHVPNFDEFWTLVNLYGGQSGPLKETGLEHWVSPNDGATNISGFTARPGGSRESFGFRHIGTEGQWWTSGVIEEDPHQSYFRFMSSFHTGALWEYGDQASGKSVRCLKDLQTVTTGNTDVYSSSSTASNRRAIPVTFTEDGVIKSLSIYHNGGTPGRMLMGVYSDQSGSPATLLWKSDAIDKRSTAGWQTVNVFNPYNPSSPVHVTSGQTVWLSWVFETSTGVRYMTGTPQRAQSTASWSGGMPTPFGSASYANYKYSVYCTYTTASQTPFLDVSPTDVSLTSDGLSRSTIYITSNTSWNITDDAIWLFREPYLSESGSGNGTVNVYAEDANTGTSPRSATVTIEGIGVASKTVTVTQEYQTNTKTIGNTTVFDRNTTGNYRRAIPVTFTEAGTIQSLSINHVGDGAGTGDFRLGIYSDQSGYPAALLRATNSTEVNSWAGWQTVLLSSPVAVSAGQKVWLAWVFETQVGVKYANTTTGEPQRAQSTAAFSYALPATFGSSALGSYKYSVYCTYTSSGAKSGSDQSDINSGKLISDEVAINPNDPGGNQEKVLIFPNPTNGSVTVKWDNFYSGRLILTIYNLQGHPVKTVQIEPEINLIQVDLNDIKGGMSLFELKDMNGVIIKRSKIVRY